MIINGRRVIEDGEVTRPTLLSLRIPLDAPGPIMLHGHKGTCQYRNVRIKPLRTATGASPTKVATQPAEQQLVRVMEKLKELNPGFDGKETHKIEDQSVVELKVSAIGLTDISPVAALKQLRLFHCNANTRTRSALTDISPLRGLPLTSVELNETAVGDLSPLAGMSLINLHLHCPQVTDLSPVKGMPLKHFCCASTHVSDLSPLKSMHLDWIVCDASLFQSPKNVAVLQAMTTLKTICHKPAAEFWRQLKNNPSFTVSHPASEKGAADSDAPRPSAFLREVATLPAKTQIARVVAELKKLNPDFDEQETHVIKDGAVTELVLSPPATARIRNISPVRALANLQKLRCTGSRKFGGPSPLADLSPLAGLCLKDLNIYLTSVRDLSPLKGMPLESLRWDSCAVKDLSSLAGLPLKFFSCYDNSQLCDLSPLKGAPLTELICSFTAVDDLSPLRDSPLNRLAIANTRVRDLSVLRGKPITFLNCQKTPVSDFSPLKDIPISSLRCDFVPARDTAVLRSIKTLEAINAIPVAELWKKVEAGEVPKAK